MALTRKINATTRTAPTMHKALPPSKLLIANSFSYEMISTMFFNDQNKTFTPQDADRTTGRDCFFAARRPQLSINLHTTFLLDLCPGFSNFTDQLIQVMRWSYASGFHGFSNSNPQKASHQCRGYHGNQRINDSLISSTWEYEHGPNHQQQDRKSQIEFTLRFLDGI